MRKRGAAPGKPLGADTLPPQLAIDALVAAMRARFSLEEAAADKLLRPALADFRDAVGCADPLLLPANHKSEPQLVPLPLPSWCAELIDLGIVEIVKPPHVEGPRVVLQAALSVVREAELEGVERFAVTFAGRFAPDAPAVHLAISPPFLGDTWRGPVCVRAAMHRSGKAVKLRVGAPSSPAGPAAGEPGETVATWAASQRPRWVVVRLLEGREPQALWSLPALWTARMKDAPEGATGTPAGAPVAMRLAVDLGSTSTVVVEEHAASSGAPGGTLAPSGFRRLAGDAATAHLYGCGEQLRARASHLPTALAAGSPGVLRRLFSGEDVALQLWLPQEGEGDPPLLADRFKSPELLLLSEWLASMPEADPRRVSRALLEAYGRLLGLSLAAAHASPLVVTEGGRWVAHLPRLFRAEAVLTYPQCAWSADEPFQRVFDDVGRALCGGLSAAWPSPSHALVADPAAARTARGGQAAAVEAFVDLGGLTLQVTVRVPAQAGRPAPFIAGSSTTYVLGGERVLDAAAFAAADGDREAFRAQSRRWRSLIGRGEHAAGKDARPAGAIRDAIASVVLPIVRRQIDATLRRAGALRGAPLRLLLLGEGWKLAALDAPDAEREQAAVARIERWFGPGVEIARIDKRRLCRAALVTGTLTEAGPTNIGVTVTEMQGVDVGSEAGLLQRWFGVADEPLPPGTQPLAADAWWREFAGDQPSRLRIEQWFGGAGGFASALAGGPLGFDAGRSVLKQWIDVSGASLIALRIHAALR